MKIVNPINFFTISLLVLFACSRENNSARIVGIIENLEGDTVFVTLTPYQDDPSYIFDTILSHNGRFIIDTLINELHVGKIITPEMFSSLEDGTKFHFRSKSIDFFIEPKGNLKIEAELLPELTEYKLEGGELNRQQNLFWNEVKDLRSEEARLFFEYENLFLIPTSAPEQFSEIELRMSEVRAAYHERWKEFIEKHPNFELSAFLLLQSQEDTIQKYYEYFDEEVKKSRYGQLIAQKSAAWNRISIGAIAPDFKSQTIDGNSFQLSNQRDNYLVLDFWGSWCAPCVEGIPSMKQFYSDHKDEVEFVGIACRDQENRWKSAVEEYGLEWTQILNRPGENDLSKLYAVKGYPTKIIINPEGKIDGIYLGETEDFYLALDEKLNHSK